MRWFSVPVVFLVEAPTEEAAVLLAEQQHADELVELLDYPAAFVSAVGEDVDEDSDSAFERYLVAVHVTLEAESERTALAVVEQAVAELEAAARDFRELRKATATSDPRLLAAETKEAIAIARDWLSDHLRMDAVALREGGSFDELLMLSDVLPRCFAHHYTPELVEQLIEAVERVADKLVHYPDTYLASTAEELAAHALIDEARAALETTGQFSDDQATTADRGLDGLHEVAFEDHDVLLLFDPRFDGIESGEIADQMGLANLHVRDWFNPFRPGRV
jgi:hypothetical protein